MHAESPGQPPAVVVDENESPAQALVRLLEQHGLVDRAREILEGHEARRQEKQQQAAREVLEELLQGQPPLTAEEIEAGEREWRELHSTPAR
jgi:predicted transcriptional regulator